MQLSKQIHLTQLALTIVFLLFICSAIDLVQFSGKQTPFILINFELFNQPGYFALVTKRIILTQEFLFFLLSGLIISIVVPMQSAKKGLMTVMVVIAVMMMIIANINYNNAVLPVAFSILTTLILYMLNVLAHYFVEIGNRQRLIDSFGQYVPPHLVNELSQQSKTISLDGEARTLTVFFCDLQNFTSISEQLNPKQLNTLLNEYFNVMTEIIFKYEGTIDKYIGDAIMAFWNAPLKQEQHANKAVNAALEMNQAILKLSKSFVARGWPGPTMGTGINSGRAHVGNMGSRHRVTYTAIGDAVNLASRIEALTRTYRVPIIISEETMRQLENISCREIDLVQVKGKKNKTRLFQPLYHTDQLSNELKEKLILHEEALSLYYDGKLKNAVRLFTKLYELDKSDKYYKAMVKRIIELHPDLMN